VITERLPGYYRYETLRHRGVAVEFERGDYDELADKLRDRAALAAATARAMSERVAYSFEATIEPLIAFLERISSARVPAGATPAGTWPSRAALRLARARAWLDGRRRRAVTRIKVGRLAAALRPRDAGATT
jgi:hypothetical protein